MSYRLKSGQTSQMGTNVTYDTNVPAAWLTSWRIIDIGAWFPLWYTTGAEDLLGGMIMVQKSKLSCLFNREPVLHDP